MYYLMNWHIKYVFCARNQMPSLGSLYIQNDLSCDLELFIYVLFSSK